MGYNTIPCNPYPISTEDINKGNNDDLNTRVAALEEDVSTLEGDVSDLNSDKANKIDIATEFSDLTNYNAGDLVYYEGALYEFQVDHTAGAWETSEVIQKDLSDIVTTLKSGLTNILSAGLFSVACTAGVNKFSRSTATLLSGSFPSGSFGRCLYSVVNHGTSANAPNTVEADGNDDILISAVTAQNITVRWLDLTNLLVH